MICFHLVLITHLAGAIVIPILQMRILCLKAVKGSQLLPVTLTKGLQCTRHCARSLCYLNDFLRRSEPRLQPKASDL